MDNLDSESMEPRTNDWANQILRSPVGCCFLLTIERDQIPVDLAVTPPQAFVRAAIASDVVNPWSPSFERDVRAAFALRSRLENVAREVAAHSGSHWWTAPFDRTRQVLVTSDELETVSSRSASPKSSLKWEDYAERPVGWRITSTQRGRYSCLDAVISRGVGDWVSSSAYARFEAEIDESARVLEIVDSDDWHALCVAHPRTNRDLQSPAGAGTLVPDWTSVATQWDGVHLTFMALLTAPFVRHRSAAGTTMLWSWDTEGTWWLPGACVRAGAPLGIVDRVERNLPDISPLIWMPGCEFPLTRGGWPPG